MTRLTYSACTALFLLSCGQKSTNEHSVPVAEKFHKSDTSVYAILKFDTSDTWLFKNAKPTNLTQIEIVQIEAVLKNYVDYYNQDQQQRFDSLLQAHPEYQLKLDDFIIHLARYKRQYIPVINSQGQKEVWINCFCGNAISDWKREVVTVDDGGNCYFNLIINLISRSVHGFIVNGEG